MVEDGRALCSEKFDWNAVYTRHHHENSIAQRLAANGFEVFLPTYDATRQWSDRKKHVSVPLFPCYVFVHTNFQRRFDIIATPGVHFVVTFAGQAAVIPDREINAIRKAVESKLRLEPHPFLQRGNWVRVSSGPLADVEGILVRKKSSQRLILSARLLGQSIAVEIDAVSVEPIQPRTTVRLSSLAQPGPFAKPQLAS